MTTEFKRSVTPSGRPVCTVGVHLVDSEQFFYTINPAGGYGRDEVLCCEACIQRPENEGIKRRMIEVGAVELEN